jgi:hypothetical protein
MHVLQCYFQTHLTLLLLLNKTLSYTVSQINTYKAQKSVEVASIDVSGVKEIP